MVSKTSISNILIMVSIVATVIAMSFPQFQIYENWGINLFFLDHGYIIHYFLQIFTGTFLHSGMLHLIFNSIFIYYFGNMVEIMLGTKKYSIFFIFIVLFNGILFPLFSIGGTTIGISGFALALLTYYTLELKSIKNPEYKGGITAIIINLALGFVPGISFSGHLFGVIGGIIFYYINKNFFKNQEVGFIEKYKELLKEATQVQPENMKKE